MHLDTAMNGPRMLKTMNISYSAHLTETGNFTTGAGRPWWWRCARSPGDSATGRSKAILPTSSTCRSSTSRARRESLQCVTTEKAVELQFSPPTRTLSGEPIHDLAGFRIYRSSTGQPGSFELLGETARIPPTAIASLNSARPTITSVRAVFGKPGHLALSDASPPEKVTPA